MDSTRIKILEAAGYTVSDYSHFLELTGEEQEKVTSNK